MPWLEKLYIVVASVSFLVLLCSVLLGFEHDVEVAHDIEVEHDFEHEVGHSDISDAPSWFSMKVLTAALVGFGVFGIGAFSVGLASIVTIPIAVFGFFGMAVLVRELVLKPLSRQQSNTLLSRQDYVGCTGRLSLAVLEGGQGEVSFIDPNGARVRETAISKDGKELRNGTYVIIIGVSPSGLIVDRNPLVEMEQ